MLRRCGEVIDVDRRIAADQQRAGKGLETHNTRVRDGIGVQVEWQVLADIQRLVHHGLMPGLRGMNTENEIATGLVDLIIQFN